MTDILVYATRQRSARAETVPTANPTHTTRTRRRPSRKPIASLFGKFVRSNGQLGGQTGPL